LASVKSYVISLPERLLRSVVGLGAGAVRTGHVFASALLQPYRETMAELKQVGYFTYASRQMRPYITASIALFSPRRRTVTDWLIERLSRR
jgi:hypothetical protein